uniref:Scm polycomb group protein like 2 n=1 Tax=Gadus morhua TaxID=8049 RepID=A0A8C4Z817_GADMO
MQTSYRLPNPLPPLPVRKGVRGRRPKLQTIALLKAAAEAAAAAAEAHGSAHGAGPPLAPRIHKKRGPKPGSKRKPRVVQSLGGSTVATPTPETRFSSSHASTDSNHSNVCVYINKHGDYGPHLDRKLVQQLPDHFGPAPVNAVLQQSVQACVDCTYTPAVLLPFLQSQAHTGGEVIRVRSDHGIRYVKLPSASSTSSVLRFLETLCQHLQSDCLFSSQPFSPQAKSQLYERTKSGESPGPPARVPPGVRLVGGGPRHTLQEPLHHGENGLSGEDSKTDMVSAASEYTFDMQIVLPHPPAARGSTTGPDHMTQDREGAGSAAASWSVDDVIRFVQEADPQTLGPHVELFRKHEIDGKALMLLRSDVIMKYMGLKLGPALKLCHHIEKLKQAKP